MNEQQRLAQVGSLGYVSYDLSLNVTELGYQPQCSYFNNDDDDNDDKCGCKVTVSPATAIQYLVTAL